MERERQKDFDWKSKGEILNDKKNETESNKSWPHDCRKQKISKGAQKSSEK